MRPQNKTCRERRLILTSSRPCSSPFPTSNFCQLRKSGSQISSERHHTSLMPRHHKYLFLQHICPVEKISHCISHFGCPILDLLRRGRNFVQERRRQLHVMTMDHRAGGWI